MRFIVREAAESLLPTAPSWKFEGEYLLRVEILPTAPSWKFEGEYLPDILAAAFPLEAAALKPAALDVAADGTLTASALEPPDNAGTLAITEDPETVG